MPLYSFTYAIPYLILLLVLFFLYLNEDRKIRILSKSNSQGIACFLIIAFLGLRGHVNTDFISYYPFFNKLPIITDLSDIASYREEPGFIIYSSVIKTLFPDYYFWVFVNTLIDLLALSYVFRRYSNSVVLSLIVFLAFYGMAIETNLYRNSKGIILFLLSIPYLEKRSFFRFLALNLLGCTFHVSSLMYIPLYFLLIREIPRMWIWILFTFSNIVFFLGVSLSGYFQGIALVVDSFLGSAFTDKMVVWEKSETLGGEYGFTLGYIERLLSFLFFAKMSDSAIKYRKSNRIFYNAFLYFYFLFHLLSPISTSMMARLSLLFAFSYWFMFPNMLAQLTKRSIARCVSFAVCFLCFYKVWVSTDSLNMKYSNIMWRDSEDYAERTSISFRIMREHFKR